MAQSAASACGSSSAGAILCGSGSRRARERAERERRLLDRYSELLAAVDGVLCFGGDGLLSEVVNGLLLRTRQQHALSDATHTSDSLELQPALRIGALHVHSLPPLSPMVRIREHRYRAVLTEASHAIPPVRPIVLVLFACSWKHETCGQFQ